MMSEQLMDTLKAIYTEAVKERNPEISDEDIETSYKIITQKQRSTPKQDRFMLDFFKRIGVDNDE